jgi:3-deoxy-manno-octulosonate cytidylyltransferase (CMP-KDO synthetase)
MIRRVYEQASLALETLYVATDDDRICEAVKAFGGKVVMTSTRHKSGTDRCAEAVDIIERENGLNFDVVLNVQGDEPFLAPEQLETLKSCFYRDPPSIATLVKPVRSREELFDPNRPKVVVSSDQRALYFSRSTIPYIRGKEPDSWIDSHVYYLHIGLYGFSRNILPVITSLPQSPLELAESLEQLRWIEHGYHIAVRTTDVESFGVDTPEDLERLL